MTCHLGRNHVTSNGRNHVITGAPLHPAVQHLTGMRTHTCDGRRRFIGLSSQPKQSTAFGRRRTRNECTLRLLKWATAVHAVC